MMMLLAPNFPSISHCVLGKNAVGVPYTIGKMGDQNRTPAEYGRDQLTQVSVLILLSPFRTSSGGLPFLGQNQILMKESVRSKPKKPPSLALKAGPNEFPTVSATPHPALPFTRALQSVKRVVPV